MDNRFASTPKPPYHAVIFSNRLNSDHDGYQAMAEKMAALAAEQPGYLGAESTRDAEGFGITISYWTDEPSIADWKANAQHLIAQKMGIDKFYRHFELRVAKVERAYSGPEGR